MFEGFDAQVRQAIAEAGLLPSTDELGTGVHGSLADHLLQSGQLEAAAIVEAVAAIRGMPVLKVRPEALSNLALEAVPRRLAERDGLVPLGESEGGLRILTGQAFNDHQADDLSFSLDRPVVLELGEAASVQRLHEAAYGGREPAGGQRPPSSAPEAEEAGGDSGTSVAELLRRILERAIEEGASDVHFDPSDERLQVRYRLGGEMEEQPALPSQLGESVTAGLKVLADMDVAERRIPQDGRFGYSWGSRTVDVRASTIPTEWGEAVALRILDGRRQRLRLEELGMPADVMEGVRMTVARPHGILVVTGPTGSGKTTTLYSALAEVNREERKVLTAEDPVEYELGGIVQTPLRSRVGFGFAEALRAFLRQDPDIILVGEVRDEETAAVAVQASLTGHLVMTTLHTRDAPGAVLRLSNLGIEPFLLAASLEAVLAQRLLRRLCGRCRWRRPAAAAELRALGLSEDGLALSAAVGCPHCGGTGYAGRFGIFEWMPVKEEMRTLIAEGASASRLGAAARRMGMRGLREEGIAALARGDCRMDDVLRQSG